MTREEMLKDVKWWLDEHPEVVPSDLTDGEVEDLWGELVN